MANTEEVIIVDNRYYKCNFSIVLTVQKRIFAEYLLQHLLPLLTASGCTAVISHESIDD